jgi:3-hydroxyanthranilate 3,4-dioxygenase
VVERRRRPDELDRVLWRCDRCAATIHEVEFHAEDLEGQLADALEAYAASADRRTCPSCGTVAPVPGEFRGEAP